MEHGIEIIHHGGASGVTGSCHELRLGDDSLLVDCGLFQGREGRNPSGFDFDPAGLCGLVATHCHLDHIGRIPYLFAGGFRGPIFCSEPTARLLPLAMEDALEVGFTRDRRLIREFLALMGKSLRPLAYGAWKRVKTHTPGVTLDIRLKPAGHILGSAYVEARVRGRGPERRVVFSGDLGAPYAPLLSAPKPPYGADVLVLESTYGDRLHDGRRDRQRRLGRIIERCIADRGVVLVPAFSIGRTQELLYELEGLFHRHGGEPGWQELEVVLDSPLAADYTRIYRELRPFWDAEAQRRFAAGRRPLGFPRLTTVSSHDDHRRAVDYLARRPRPTVVLAASGMCTGGRIVDWLKACIGDRRTDVLFVGYQAEGTPGRDIQRYGPRGGWVELEGRRYDIRAGVQTLSGYSAHADQRNLVSFVRRMRRRPEEIRLVHGERAAREGLAAALREVVPGARIVLPSEVAELVAG